MDADPKELSDEDSWIQKMAEGEKGAHVAAGSPTPVRYQSEVGEFHESNGWFFKRLEGGRVRIRVVHYPENRVVEDHIIEAFPWCSVIAHLGRYGETLHTWNEAKAFHGVEEASDVR